MLSISGPLSTHHHARRYAPEAVKARWRALARSERLGVVIDVDALDGSIAARIDRVMMLALRSLADAGVTVAFAGLAEYGRSARLAREVPNALATPTVAELRDRAPDVDWLIVGDDPTLLAEAGAVRAALWWLLAERTRAA
jgi:hypothetical protein